MDDHNTYEKLDALKNKLSPPPHTISTILNGAGNGGILVGVALFARNMFKNKTQDRAGMAILGAGTTLGAIYGLYEAKFTQKYRDNMSMELVKLRAEMDEQKKWTAKLHGQDAASIPTRGV